MNIGWSIAVAIVGLGVIVLCIALYVVIQHWSHIVRGAQVIWFTRGRAIGAFCAVYLLGGSPVGAHLFAVQTNEQASTTCEQFDRVLIADVYLFGFIIAIAGVVDALSLGQRGTAIVFVVLALVTGFGNYNGTLDAVVSHPIGTLLAVPVWAIVGVCAVGYAWFKVLSLYAAGTEDWEKAERERAARRKRDKP